MRHGQRHGQQLELQVAVEQVGDGRRLALVVDLGEFDAGDLLHELGAQVVGRAVAGAGVVQAARLGLGQRHECLQVGHAQLHRHHRHVGYRSHVGHALHVARVVPFGRRDHVRAGDDVRRSHQQRVAVGGLAQHVLGADGRIRPGLGFDHDGLAEQRAHAVGHRAGQDVDHAAGRERHDDAQRFARKGLGERRACDDEACGERERAHAMDLLHGVSSGGGRVVKLFSFIVP